MSSIGLFLYGCRDSALHKRVDRNAQIASSLLLRLRVGSSYRNTNRASQCWSSVPLIQLSYATSAALPCTNSREVCLRLDSSPAVLPPVPAHCNLGVSWIHLVSSYWPGMPLRKTQSTSRAQSLLSYLNTLVIIYKLRQTEQS